MTGNVAVCRSFPYIRCGEDPKLMPQAGLSPTLEKITLPGRSPLGDWRGGGGVQPEAFDQPVAFFGRRSLDPPPPLQWRRGGGELRKALLPTPRRIGEGAGGGCWPSVHLCRVWVGGDPPPMYTQFTWAQHVAGTRPRPVPPLPSPPLLTPSVSNDPMVSFWGKPLVLSIMRPCERVSPS